jgi:hypothetical protein
MLVVLLVMLLAVLFLIAGCSSDDGAAGEPTAAAAATTESTTTTAAPTTTAATTTTTTTEPTGPNRFDEIEALIEGYLASWETKDEEALRASVADTFVLNEYVYSISGELRHTVNDDADGVAEVGFGYSWQNETVGESLVTGDGPWTVAHRELWQEQANQYDGIATYVVIDDGETLKITNHHWAGISWTEF